jgi:DNA polymerase-3 subunit epsilon
VTPLTARAEEVALAAPVFAALDFETADYGRDSACALGVVRVEGDAVVARETRLIRPPRSRFVFTYIHGIEWEDVADAPAFADVWRDCAGLLDGARFLVAHNASFDRGVIEACCARAGIAPPAVPFACTVRWARRTFGLRRANLPAVCEHLGIPLHHHDAGSDAEACARIMIAVRREWRRRFTSPAAASSAAPGSPPRA